MEAVWHHGAGTVKWSRWEAVLAIVVAVPFLAVLVALAIVGLVVAWLAVGVVAVVVLPFLALAGGLQHVGALLKGSGLLCRE